MLVDFVPTGAADFLADFAAAVGGTSHGNTLTLPPALGHGSLQLHTFQPGFDLILHRYTLAQELTLRRRPATPRTDLLCLVFYHNQAPIAQAQADEYRALSRHSAAGATLSTDDISGEFRLPAHTPIMLGIITLRLPVLRDLLGSAGAGPGLLSEIQEGRTAFFLYEDLNLDLLVVLNSLGQGPPPAAGLPTLFYRLKALELLYLFATKLARRQRHGLGALSPPDVARVFEARTHLLADLAAPPTIARLAAAVGLSETRLKTLFRQVFGESIYAYLQLVRVAQAKELLRAGALTVGQVGAQLGFTNLSHFARLFGRVVGATPKKYARNEAVAGTD